MNWDEILIKETKRAMGKDIKFSCTFKLAVV